MNTFFSTTCHKCGLIDEAKFIYAGPHIKQVCNGCGFYVKFFDKALLPDVKAIREKIWYISKGDKELIEQAKKACEFIQGLSGVNGKMMYWRLYLEIRRKINSGV